MVINWGKITSKNSNWSFPLSIFGTRFPNSQHTLDVHRASEVITDYWSSVHNRNSIDDAGLRVLSYVHLGSNRNNAVWISDWGGRSVNAMFFGDGNGILYGPFTSLDIVWT